ncbi:calmodulin-binding transcription activator (camta), plants, putative [Ricinus communis]|uniref:Calmodulin-binding transcription activator (Camta), plants, putative n=1 Tax=Ricinus communis TaxID=3988 RepID=B9S036_RICCO|nr:calmodulin-binding transcription activator (camta), plants, putative [Ricinus communis]
MALTHFLAGGSLFLFDRKVLRYFRKDGHNWRKKKDGKTVREAHEKLKVVCLYNSEMQHSSSNYRLEVLMYYTVIMPMVKRMRAFKGAVIGCLNSRRIAGLVVPDLTTSNSEIFLDILEGKERNGLQIVLLKFPLGNATESRLAYSWTNNSPSNSLIASSNKEPSGNTDSTSPTSTLTSFCEDADSADSQQVNSGHHSYLESPLMQSSPVIGKMNAGALSSHFLHPGSGPISYVHGDRPGNNGSSITEAQSLKSWEEVLEQCTRGDKNAPSHLSTTSTQSDATGIGRSMTLKLAYDLDTRLLDQRTHNVDFPTTLEEFFSGPIHQNEELVHNNHHMLLTHADQQLLMHTKSENDMSVEENGKYAFILKQPLLDGEEGLKKVDSFSRWVTRELGEVDDLHMKSSSGIPWSTVECGTVVDESSLSPSLSQDQLFSIIDFSPKWGYADSKTEVHISGTFLKSQHEVTKYNWSCMFGELEVPAEVLADGILCCYAPPHSVASVPFYVTCSNRLACSEVREFDYQSGSAEDVDVLDVYGGDAHDMYLHLRLERLLSLRSSSPSCLFDGAREKHNLVEKLILLKEEDEGCQVAETTSERQLSQDEIRNKFLQKGMQEKLYSWLLHTVAECGKGPSMLDDDGQGMLHLAAALGYDWAIKPTMTAGVSINFRDVNGWTALHWAAFYGREQTVAALVSLGADTRVLTDPSPEFPLGSTPADLASGNGHKGISGFLAESSLTSYLHLLTLNDSVEGGAPEGSGMTAVQTISERMATPVKDGDVPNVLSLKDSLTAIRNATQAANRIYQVFRMQSFQRKQLTEYSDDEIGMLDERALALIAAKTPKPLHSDGVVNAAAIQIQKKYRGWKKRKEFLIIRQRIVKIQAHIRGHQVRKQYRTIIWSVGILEKVILRWRRKGSGLRGFRREALPIPKESNVQCENPKEDDYDFLKEGRKQNEVRQQKALTRVKSMYHCSEGQAQYRRLLNYFEKFRETKENEMILSSPNEMAYGENLIDIDSLLDDDTFMSIAFE